MTGTYVYVWTELRLLTYDRRYTRMYIYTYTHVKNVYDIGHDINEINLNKCETWHKNRDEAIGRLEGTILLSLALGPWLFLGPYVRSNLACRSHVDVNFDNATIVHFPRFSRGTVCILERA